MTLPNPWQLTVRKGLMTLMMMTMIMSVTRWTCPSRLPTVTSLMVRSPSCLCVTNSCWLLISVPVNAHNFGSCWGTLLVAFLLRATCALLVSKQRKIRYASANF